MKTKELNKLLKAARYVKQARMDINDIDKLKLSLASRNLINRQIQSVHEALEFLELKIEDIVTNKLSGGK